MYICSECGLRIGAEDETELNEPSRPGPCCVKVPRVRTYADDFDADELGLDPEEEYDA